MSDQREHSGETCRARVYCHGVLLSCMLHAGHGPNHQAESLSEPGGYFYWHTMKEAVR